MPPTVNLTGGITMARPRASVRTSGDAPAGFDKGFLDQRRRLTEFKVREARDRARRRAVAARQRQRQLAAAAKTLGVPVDRLDALHEADWELIRRQAKALESSAITLLRRQHTRQRAAFRNVMKNRKRLEYQGGNPVHTMCLWRAARAASVSSFPFTFNEGTAGLDSPAPVAPPPTTGNNLIRFTGSAHAAATSTPTHLTPVAGTELVTSHVFRTTAARNGVVSVTANYAPLGTIFLGAPGDCYGFAGEALARVELFFKVRVGPSRFAMAELPSGPSLVILDEEIQAGCDGVSRLLPVGVSGGESFQVANPDLGAAETGDTIEVNVGYSIYLSTAWRGDATATFAAANAPFFGLNVPVVVVKIEA
jgi:hypothetical protein